MALMARMAVIAAWSDLLEGKAVVMIDVTPAKHMDKVQRFHVKSFMTCGVVRDCVSIVITVYSPWEPHRHKTMQLIS
jgi:hypothetical protein